MPSVGNYYLTITPSFEKGAFSGLSKELSSGIDAKGEGERTGESFSGGLTGKLSALSVAAGTVLGNALSGAVGYVSGFVDEAIQASDATDKFKSTLDFAGIDSSEIERLTVAAQDYADKTVYDLSDIQNITAQLAANGVKDFDRIAEAAGNLNAVAGGDAETFSRVGTVLTQTASAGKLTTENWMQLADAIPGGSGKIKEALAEAGAYTGDFSEAMSNGEITAEEFNQAILDLGFQDAAVNAAQSATTMEGAMGNMEASIQKLLVNGFELIKPVLTDIINGVAEFVGAMATGLGSITESPFFTVVIDALQRFGETVMPVLTDAWSRLAPLFQSFAETVAPVLGQVFSTLLDVIGQLVATALPPLIAIFEALSPLFETAVTIVGGLVSAFGEFASYLIEQCDPALQALADLFASAMPAIQAVFEGAWNACKAVIDAVWPAIQGVIEGAMGVIQGIIDTVTALIRGDWEGVWKGIQEIFSGVWEAIKGIVDAAINGVRSVIETVLNAIRSLWESIWNGISDYFSGLWDGITSIADAAINGVSDVIGNVLDAIRSGWESAWNAIGDFLGGAWDNIVRAVSAGIDGVLGFIRDLPGNILNALGDLGNLLWNAGKGIIDGFLRGLQAAWDTVTGWIGGIGDWIASHKGPLDYDRKLLIPAGEAIMEGFGQGLEDGFDPIQEFVSAIDGHIEQAFEPDRLLWDVGVRILEGLAHGFASRFDYLATWVDDVLQDGFVAEAEANDPDRLLWDVGERIMGGLVDGMRSGVGYVRSDVSSMAEEINGAIGTGIVPRVGYELNANMRASRSIAGDVYDGVRLAMGQDRSKQPIYLVMDGQVVAKTLSDPMDETWGLKARRITRLSAIAR